MSWSCITWRHDMSRTVMFLACFFATQKTGCQTKMKEVEFCFEILQKYRNVNPSGGASKKSCKQADVPQPRSCKCIKARCSTLADSFVMRHQNQKPNTGIFACSLPFLNFVFHGSCNCTSWSAVKFFLKGPRWWSPVVSVQFCWRLSGIASRFLLQI